MKIELLDCYKYKNLYGTPFALMCRILPSKTNSKIQEAKQSGNTKELYQEMFFGPGKFWIKFIFQLQPVSQMQLNQSQVCSAVRR